MVYNFFDKKTPEDAVKNENMSNQKVSEELHKASIKIFEIRKIILIFYLGFWPCQ